MKGLITKSTGLWYEVVVDGKTRIGRLRGKMRLENELVTNPVAVGDFVEVEPNKKDANDLVITSVLPRTNYVTRRSPRKKGFEHVLASNIDQGVLIATLKMPRTSIGFIDRFLISLEAFRIPGILLFNKKDLYKDKDLALFTELKQVYESIGYKVALISAKGDDTLHISEWFHGKVSLLSGHSGSGKSTLVNRLIPGAAQETDEISSFANKGKHTTTFAQMFHINNQSSLIDTPGIKELGLSEIADEELSHYFPEMRALLGSCKFHNCMHVKESGCKIKEEVGNSISQMRYDSYLHILNEEDSRR